MARRDGDSVPGVPDHFKNLTYFESVVIMDLGVFALFLALIEVVRALKENGDWDTNE